MIEQGYPFLNKAVESLIGAESEFINKRYNNTANRAYYACSQAAIAALQRAGVRPRREEWSHEFVETEASRALRRSRTFVRAIQAEGGGLP